MKVRVSRQVITFLTLVFCILDLSREFYNPFGQDPINFPVLTWVASAAAECGR